MHILIRPPLHHLAGLLLALPILCQASGSLPIPESKQSYPSFQACVRVLEEQYQSDRQQVVTEQQLTDGRTRQVALDSKGLQATGKQGMAYHATLWYHHGAPRADLQQMEISHTFEERHYECKGRQLVRQGRNGYTLSTFEPMGKPQ